MIEVEGLRKEYSGGVVAVDGVTFTARSGEVFGLLGPNGAGKSTTIGCISGLLAPTAGRVRVTGRDVVRDGLAARAALGVVPQELALYEDLSAAENLRYWGGAQGLRGDGLKRGVADALDAAGLADRAGDLVRTFSGGMKRRLNFASGIVHRPPVLLLDEPTVGVDPQSRVRLLDLVRGQAATGTCVLYTTHYMEEAQELCDRLAIIDRGRIVAQGTLPELRALLGERDVVRLAGRFDRPRVSEALSALGDLELVQVEEDRLTVAVPEGSRRLPSILAAVAASGGEVRETVLAQPSLESLFIKLTGAELRE